MRERSYMIVIPKDEKYVNSPNYFMENLKNNERIQIENAGMDDERGLVVDLKIDNLQYQIEVNPTAVEIPNMFRPQHVFSEEEIKLIDNAEAGISVNMDFEGDNARCFYDQIRIIDAMFPEILAVLDCPSEKLLSGKWVSLAAKSDIMPSPRYLFTVQAVSDGDDEVWLHTHGLKRLGMYELEILFSNKETYNDHYKIIENFAIRMIESEEPIEIGEPVYVGQSGEMYLVCTAVDWKEALDYYKDVKLGIEEDRDEFHSEDTCVIMMYKNKDDADNRIYTPVQEFDPYLEKNPMYMFSSAETERMSNLAIERIPYMVKGFENKDNTILVKVGLITDKEYWNDDGTPQREHIWFELKDIKDGIIVAELTQEPYYVSNIKTGDVGTYSFEEITDWIIYTKTGHITPDDVYLM